MINLRSLFQTDDRGQSEVIGAILVLSLVALGITAIVVYGAVTLDDMQAQTELEQAEKAMALFDSRVAMVALGESSAQSIPMGQTEGSYRVAPSAGSITITHKNYDGTKDEVLYQAPLGAVTYEREGTTVAYQGGGVWRKDPSGASTMVSPPEFHYRGATLTLPVIQASGSGGAAGRPIATIAEVHRAKYLYPATTATNPNAPYDNNQPYANPISGGQIVVTVRSEYADGWAEFFRSRTGGTVTVSGDTVNLQLSTLGPQGRFPMPGEGAFLFISGFPDTHSEQVPGLEHLTITLRPDRLDSADFSNLQWSLFVDQGEQQFELHLRRRSGKDCSNIPVVSTTIYYSPDNGRTYQGWYNPSVFVGECGEYNNNPSDGKEIRLQANLRTTSVMTYQKLDSSHLEHFSTAGATLQNPVTFNQHGSVDDGTYSAGNQLPMNVLMDHYFALLGRNFHLTVDDKSSNTVTEEASYGEIRYPASADTVTYLHVTENRVHVTFN